MSLLQPHAVLSLLCVQGGSFVDLEEERESEGLLALLQ